MSVPTKSAPCFGGYTYDAGRQRLIHKNGKSADLRAQSLEVFLLLAKNAGRVVSKDEIFSTIWKGTSVTDDSLVQCIGDIRRALEDNDHKLLKTISRRGYVLIPDAPIVSQTSVHPSAGGVASRSTKPRRAALLAVAAIIVALIINLGGYRGKSESNLALETGTPRLSIAVNPLNNHEGKSITDIVLPELRVALSRYRTIKLTEKPASNYQVVLNTLDAQDSTPRLTAELIDNTGASLIFAESYEILHSMDAGHALAVRVAAAIASPGVGALGRHLLATSRLKPVEELTREECYANGFGCTKCSGEEDNITRRAEACLAQIIEHDPDDSRAWALQATIYAHQYWWGNTLSEPQRSNLSLRRDLPQKAIEAANKAEALSDGTDSSVYWGMAQAYFASCQVDKLQAAVRRGLEINPDDPNLLAAFGNWLSFTGRWDEGAALAQRAIEIEPRGYKKWWWMGEAKKYYFREDFSAAYNTFLKSFNERNWLSHSQMAYTLPFLGRIPEAKMALDELERLSPGFTVERALEVYKTFCFPDSFLVNIKRALTLAGMPSRGNSADFENISLPRAKTVRANGRDIEYMDVGSGEPVLFVHGSISDYRTWAWYLLPISEQYRYISYSQRYFGTQPWMDNGEGWSSDNFAQDLIELIEALDIGPVHLVSWSSGALAAVIASVNRPDLIKSAVHFEPVDGNIFAGDESIKPIQQDYFSEWKAVYERLNAGDNEVAAEKMLEVVFEMEAGDYQQETEAVQEVIRQNARTLPLGLSKKDRGDTKLTCDYVKQIKVPTKIVLGGLTGKYLTQMSKRFVECIPGATLTLIDGINHRGPIGSVDQFSKIIIDFVDLIK